MSLLRQLFIITILIITILNSLLSLMMFLPLLKYYLDYFSQVLVMNDFSLKIAPVCIGRIW